MTPQTLCVAAALSLLGAASAHAFQPLQPGSIEAGTLALPSGPASVRGLADDASLDVFTGQIGYRVPFDLPAGPGGFAPRVALTHEGSLGNGVAGVGWTLTLPAIRRSTRLGVPAFTSDDELELVGVGPGGRLFPAGDGSGTWRLEGQGQAYRVEWTGSGSPGAAAIVTDSDGVRYLMGWSTASRVYDPASGAVLEWKVQQINHPSGQVINFVYSRDGGDLQPSSIRWAGNAFRCDFHYEARPDGHTSYRGGFPLTRQRRLSRVDVVAFGFVRRQYVPGYDDDLPLTRLSEVEMRGLQGKGALPKVVFEYGESGGPSLELHSGLAGWALDLPGNTLMDVDGDGVADLVHLGQTHTFRRNELDGFAAAAPIPKDTPGAYPALSQLRLMDMQGRARPAMVTVVGNQWQVEQLESSGWVSIGAWADTANVPLTSADVAFADIDGDGRSDLIQAVASDLRVRLNTPGALESTPIGQAPAPGIFPGAPGVLFRDMNGDGLADAVALAPSWVDVYPGRGDGTFAARVRTAFPAELANAPADTLRLGDLDSNGVTDFVRITANEVLWLPMRPDGSFMREPSGAVRVVALARPSGAPSTAVVAVADANGNGSQDVVWSFGAELWVMDLAGASSAAMLTAIHNGMGGTTRVEYEASAVLALADELAGAAWAEQLPISVPVAVELRRQLASGEPDRVTELSVRDGFYDAGERRFGGFLETVERRIGDTPETTLELVRTFEAGLGPDRVLRGRTLTETRRDATGYVFDERIHGWTARPVAGLDPLAFELRIAAEDSRLERIYEGTTSPAEVLTTFVWDGEGRLVQTFRHGDLSVAGDETLTTRTFAPRNGTSWVQGRQLTEDVTDGSGALVSRKRLLYDGAAQPLPFGQVGLGAVRRVEGWLASEARWVLLEATNYDAFFNPVERYEDGLWRELTYDSFGVVPLSETVRPSAARALTWQVVDFHYGLGRALQVEAPDGVRRKLYWDDLGRIQAVAVTGEGEQISYSYDWSAPRPTTTTVFHDAPAPTRTRVSVHNSQGEPLYQADKLGGGWLVRDFRLYDERGEATAMAEPFAAGALPTALPGGVPFTTWEPDAIGREVVALLPDGTQRATSFGPLSTTETRDGLAPVLRVLDGQGRTVLTQRTVAGSGLETAVSTWDGAGRLTSVTLQGTVTHSFGYDTLGRLVSADDPDAGLRTMAYFDNGRLQRADNAAGQSVSYSYDDIGRPTRMSGSDGTDYELVYDAGSGLRTEGRLARVIEPTGELELSYDRHGHVETWQRSVAGTTVVETRVSSPSGLLLTSIFDDGFKVTRSYDEAGRMASLGSWYSAKQRDPAGRVIQASWGNGVAQSWTRDAVGRPIETEVAVGGSALLALDIQRGPLGAPALVTDLDGVGLAHGAAYAYDDAGRLTSAQVAGAKFDYDYDGLQRLTARSAKGWPAAPFASGSYVYGGSGPRQATSAAGRAIGWDAAGRVDRVDGQGRTFDPFDKLRRVQLAGLGWLAHDYGYDGLRTLTRDHKGKLTRRFQAGLRVDANGLRHYTLRDGHHLVARVTPAKSTWLAMHYGPGAGPALVTDAKAKVLDERLYAPYGAPIAADLGLEETGGGNRPVDALSGLADHGARWLDADVAQWTAPDPPTLLPDARFAAEPWRLHPYQYVLGNPMAFWDPDGREEAAIDDKERFSSLQQSMSFERDELVSSQRNFLIDAYEWMQGQDPNNYKWDGYNAILAPSTTRSNYSAAARFTDTTHPANNRTRWALQTLLVAYQLEYGGATGPGERAATSTTFSYEIHESAFQFANNQPTIGKLPWAILTKLDVPAASYIVDPTQATGGLLIDATIWYTNPPTGDFPLGGRSVRWILDTVSSGLDWLGVFD